MRWNKFLIGMCIASSGRAFSNHVLKPVARGCSLRERGAFKIKWPEARRCYAHTLVVLFLIVIVLSGLACAESRIEVDVIENQVAIGENALFNLKITNLDRDNQKYNIYSMQSGQGWTVDPINLGDKAFLLSPGQTKEVEVVARAFGSLFPGVYYITITVEEISGEKYDRSLKIYLESEIAKTYLPSFDVIIDMDDKITPKSSVPIKLFLRNKNPLDLSSLKVKIQSEMPEFAKEAIVDLLPSEEKTVEFSIVPYEDQQPKEYYLYFVFEKDGKIIKSVEKRIEVSSLLPDFTMDITKKSVFFKKYYALNIKNEGNVLNTQEVRVPVSFLKALFTSNVKVKKINKERFFVWEATLGPNESVTINYMTNYRFLFYILLAIGLFLTFYYYVKSPLVVTKNAAAIKSEESGTLSEIKIMLDVKNRSGKSLQNVAVIDTVPAIANVAKVIEIGTLKPEKIGHTKKGTKVVWSLAELDAYEHRVIRYKVKAKLNIVGTFVLPRVVVEFNKNGKKKKDKAYSNIFRLSS